MKENNRLLTIEILQSETEGFNGKTQYYYNIHIIGDEDATYRQRLNFYKRGISIGTMTNINIDTMLEYLKRNLLEAQKP